MAIDEGLRLTRRAAIKASGAWAALGAMGCADDGADASEGADALDATATTDVSIEVRDSGPVDGGGLDDALDTSDAGFESVPWLSGGTAALAAVYPSPFISLGSQCELTCAQTLGPCYVTAPERKDISEGNSGLPMRLLIRIVGADGCTAVPNASVDIWHTDIAGVYSGPTQSPICNPSAFDVSAERFFRGWQPTDAEGIAAFDSVLPGWYPARTAHIHFTIRVQDRAWLTSQLYFDPALTEEIYASHPDYAPRGPAAVTNQTDGLIADGPIADWKQATDGALLCWTTIILRDALTDRAC